MPAVCNEYGNDRAKCASNGGCYWHCGVDDLVQADEVDGCTEFMTNWNENMENPSPFCNSQNGRRSVAQCPNEQGFELCADVPLPDCLETMKFLGDMSAAGHFTSFKSRMKLCKMFGSLPTVDIMYCIFLLLKCLKSCLRVQKEETRISVLRSESTMLRTDECLLWNGHRSDEERLQ